MSNPALTRKAQVHTLKKGEDIPCDGRIYRDSDGILWVGIRYVPNLEKYHRWRLSLIEAARGGRDK